MLPFKTSPQAAWQVIVDFDGTISRADTTDQILQRFALPGWEEIEADWIAGHIGSRECMARQIALLQASPDVFDTFVSSLAIDWGFSGFAHTCRRLAIPLTVVSDGLDRSIRVILERAGLGDLPIVANHLEAIGGDRWRLTSPHADPNGQCTSGTCKCRVAGGLDRPLTLLIGDGRSDFCVAGQADLVFAKSGLAAHCRDKGIAHHPFETFSEAEALLEALLAGRPQLPSKHVARI